MFVQMGHTTQRNVSEEEILYIDDEKNYKVHEKNRQAGAFIQPGFHDIFRWCGTIEDMMN
jgi:hypothetical protein